MSLRNEGMRLRTRVAAIVGVVVFLVLAGTGAGYAYWTANGTVAASAQSASAAVALTVPSGLTTSYTSTSSGPAGGTLTLANTGGAPLGLALTATTSGDSTLPGAISLKLWTQTGGACTLSAPGPDVTTGTLAALPALPAGATSANAGASVVLCAATSFTGSYASFAGTSTTVTLTLTGSVGTHWRPTATGTFTQNLQAASTFDSNARYNILNANICVAGKDGKVVRNGVCDFNNLGQFRITDAGSGASYVSAAMNAAQQPTAPRWSLSSATASLEMVTPGTSNSQKWVISQRADGKYRFQNVQFGTCAQVSTTQLYGSSGGQILVGATCDDSLPSQGFTFTLVNTTSPPPVTLSCSGNGTTFIDYGWPVLSEYEAEVVYKVYVNGVYVKDHTNGYWTHAQMSSSELPVAQYGSGTLSVEVKQSVAGGAWTLTGTGAIVISPGTNNIACG